MSSKNQPLSFPFPPIKTIIKPSNSDALLLLDNNSHLSAFLSPKKKKKSQSRWYSGHSDCDCHLCKRRVFFSLCKRSLWMIFCIFLAAAWTISVDASDKAVLGSRTGLTAGFFLFKNKRISCRAEKKWASINRGLAIESHKKTRGGRENWWLTSIPLSAADFSLSLSTSAGLSRMEDKIYRRKETKRHSGNKPLPFVLIWQKTPHSLLGCCS